ncbi:MAG: hypothetical protein IJ759_05935 [Bacteroidales bacterium]|nr:hypothetical protein [Bacteroidales bacterium]
MEKYGAETLGDNIFNIDELLMEKANADGTYHYSRQEALEDLYNYGDAMDEYLMATGNYQNIFSNPEAFFVQVMGYVAQIIIETDDEFNDALKNALNTK